MATSKTTIELNGKLYDARTGKIITATDDGQIAKPAKPIHHQGGTVIDGFVRPPHQAAHPAKPKPAVSRTTPQPAKPKLEKSKTLMRPAVKKPQPVIVSNSNSTKQDTNFKKQDPHRQIRAGATPRSAAIQKFNHHATSHKIIKKEAILPVATTPDHAVSHSLAGQVARLATSSEARVKQSVDMIEESLRNASSHLQTFEGKVARGSLLQRKGFKNKAANLASLSFAGLLLFGFFAYQNAPNIEMRLAAARSGVSAQMPGYSPAGFSVVHGIRADPGKVTVAFKSNTNDKRFTVTQQASNWSSDSLLSNHVLASKTPFQTYQDEGKTVYIYNNSNATWVNGGVWYRVDGDASLTSDQLLRISNSF